MSKKPSILVVYTGGTIGMEMDQVSGELKPVNFLDISAKLPELAHFGLEITTITYSPAIDSSEIEPSAWIKLAMTIRDHYNDFDGFVILHGTDTMAYSASALGFLLENLDKPVIFTGSQLPLGMLRTDGKENLISSIEIAAGKENGKAIVPEVCIFFQNRLFRGNRTTKHNADYFNAFRSYNYPLLAETGVKIKYNYEYIQKKTEPSIFKAHETMDSNVAVLKIFPGITQGVLESVLNAKKVKAVVLETYGSGNAPTVPWFISEIEGAIKRGIFLVNTTQCARGRVEMTRYATGKRLLEAGVVSGYDITTEAALAKTMFLLGQGITFSELAHCFSESIRGEIN